MSIYEKFFNYKFIYNLSITSKKLFNKCHKILGLSTYL